jgi:hypothetical protein
MLLHLSFRGIMVGLGEVQSPLEASVQELCKRSTCRGNMHMDESKPSIPSDELSLPPVSDWKSAVVDAPPADLAKSDKLVAVGRQRHSDQYELCQNDLPNGPSVAVYCGNEEEVSRGFLIALRATGVAVIEQPRSRQSLLPRARP